MAGETDAVCPKCGRRMQVVDGSERTMLGSIHYGLRCPNCLHEEQRRRPAEARPLEWRPSIGGRRNDET